MDTCIICKAPIAFPFEHFCEECLDNLFATDMKVRHCVNCGDFIPQRYIVSAYLCRDCRYECMTVKEGRDLILKETVLA